MSPENTPNTMQTPEHSTPGMQLQNWREENDMSRPVLAARVGAVRSAVRAWEMGNSFPQGEQREKLFAETHLDCFGPNAAPPPKRRPRKGLKRPGRTKFFKSPRGQKLIARYEREYTGRSQPKNLGRTGPRRRDRSQSPIVSDWELAQYVGRGKAVPGMKSNTQSARAVSLGIDYGTETFCDQGNPFSDSDLHNLRKRCRFTGERFEKIIGVPTDGGERDGLRIVEHAEKVIEWRDVTLRNLLGKTSPSYKQDRVLKTLLPNLADLDALLRECFAEIQKAMPEFTVSGVGDFVAEQAKSAARKSAHAGLWGEMLRYLVELAANEKARTFLDKNLASLPRRKDVADFVRELLAARYGASLWIVRRALLRSTAAIPPGEMCGVILSYAEPIAPPAILKSKALPGRPKGKQQAETLERIGDAAALVFLRYSQPEMIPLLYPKQHVPEAGRKTVNKLLIRNKAAIAREVEAMTHERAERISKSLPRDRK
jgi:transcriptional regulator with XRE-family HTH domain